MNLDKLIENFHFSIYPNPNNGSFQIVVDHEAFVEINNAISELLFIKKIQKGINTIDFSDQSTGVYFLKYQNSVYKILKE